MNRYKKKSFLKLVIHFGLMFLIAITLMKLIISLFNDGGINGMMTRYFSNDTWFRFVKIQLAMSAFYGIFMAGYYKYIKK